jgi:uncharacterized protein (TIGR02118 family)
MTMQICLFLTGAEPLSDASALQRLGADIRGLHRLIVHESMPGQIDPRIAPGANAPAWVLQFYFDDLAMLEAATQTHGAIHRALAAASPGDAITQQAMAVRTLTAPRPMREAAERCTYLVAYEGPADDFNAWLTHYLLHHPPLMLQLPALRELEIYTRIDCTSGMPFAHAHAMQRNNVVFDDAKALADALASPVRDAMRQDFHMLPPYHGATPHFAMRSSYGNLATH